jgi:hypothetical protein
MNLGLAKDGSTGLRAEAVMLGEMDHRGSYDWGMPTGSSVGAMGSDSRGGQPTGPQPGWSAHSAHRAFSSISAPKFLTTVHSGFDRCPAHERRAKFVDYFFFCLCTVFLLTCLQQELPRATLAPDFPTMVWMVEREIKVRQYGHILRLVAEDNFLGSAILHDKHASWYAEKPHSEGSSLYDTYITFTR